MAASVPSATAFHLGCIDQRFSISACALVACVSWRRGAKGQCWLPKGSHAAVALGHSCRTSGTARFEGFI